MIRRVYKQFLEKEIEKSPVPVFFETRYFQKYLNPEASLDCQACFMFDEQNTQLEDGEENLLPKEFIFIHRVKKSNTQKLYL